MTTSVRVVYRYHDGENGKPRPPWYGKILALLSAVRAAREAGAELHFLTDGPVPAAPLEIMRAAGTVAAVDGGSNRRSYRAMIAREARAAATAAPGRDGEDVVFFSEDDYLYRPDALVRLAEAASAIPGADYFTLHSPECLDVSSPRTHPRVRPRPGPADDPDAVRLGGADGVDWFRGFSTTSTFGLRRRALVEDARLLRLAPVTGGAWDTTTCLLVQGRRPFSRAELAADLGSLSVRGMSRGALRLAVTPRAARRPSRCRALYACDPELVAHADPSPVAPLAPPTARTAAADWSALAADTARWAVTAGFGDVAALEQARAREQADRRPGQQSGAEATAPARAAARPDQQSGAGAAAPERAAARPDQQSGAGAWGGPR